MPYTKRLKLEQFAQRLTSSSFLMGRKTLTQGLGSKSPALLYPPNPTASTPRSPSPRPTQGEEDPILIWAPKEHRAYIVAPPFSFDHRNLDRAEEFRMMSQELKRVGQEEKVG